MKVRTIPTKDMLGGLQALKSRKVSTSFEYDDSDDGVFKGNERKASSKLLGDPHLRQNDSRNGPPDGAK